MRFLLLPAVLLGFASTSLVAAVPKGLSSYSVKEEINSPRGWAKYTRPSPDHNIILRIALQQSNFPALEKHLYQASDPGHELYGQHLSKAEVEALIAPHEESVKLVNEWLATFGINEGSLVRSPGRDWVTVKVPVSLAEKMLDTVSLFEFGCLVLNAISSSHFQCRPTMSGNILTVVITWSGPRAMLFLTTSTIISS